MHLQNEIPCIIGYCCEWQECIIGEMGNAGNEGNSNSIQETNCHSVKFSAEDGLIQV
jgi:hypothetical protein